MPLSTVESPHFQRFVSALDPCYQPPSSKLISEKLMPELSISVKNRIKETLVPSHGVCLSIDMWTNQAANMNFLGIYAHFSLEWRMYSMMLACSRCKDSLTQDDVRREYEQALTFYGIADKITSTVTNKASQTDFSLPGYCPGEEFLEEHIWNNSMELEVDTKHLSAFEFLTRHSPCYAMSIQLVVRDGLYEMSDSLKDSIAKASNIVKFFQSSFSTSETPLKSSLQSMSSTKWISQLDMIRFVLSLSEEEISGFEADQLTPNDRVLLQELCTILNPFEHAMHLVGQKHQVPASIAIPVTRGIKHKLDQIKVTHSSNMLSSFRTSLSERLSRYERDDVYITAAVLDPRFKLRWSEGEEYYGVKTELVRKVSAIQMFYPTPVSICTPNIKVENNEDDLFSFMAPNNSQSVVMSNEEAEKYLSQPCIEMDNDPLQYWKSQQSVFPLLSHLASIYLAIPTVSVQNERLSKAAAKIFSPELCSLSDAAFQSTMLVNSNL